MKTRQLFIVDDDELVLEIMGNYLKDKFKSYHIKTFKTGEDCINNLNLKPDIIVLDYYLDGNDVNAEDGLATLKKIKEASRKIEIVILTKNDNEEVALNCLKYGAADYIIKNNISHIHLQLSLENINAKLDAVEKAKDSKYTTMIAVVILIILGIVFSLINYFI
jgi:DNA-binding NarL/FixJ family response regulator